MTAPTLVTELDERTRDELQPPCETTPGECDAAAAWVLRLRCPCRAHAALLCRKHHPAVRAAARLGMYRCLNCRGRAAYVASESL